MRWSRISLAPSSFHHHHQWTCCGQGQVERRDHFIRNLASSVTMQSQLKSRKSGLRSTLATEGQANTEGIRNKESDLTPTTLRAGTAEPKLHRDSTFEIISKGKFWVPICTTRADRQDPLPRQTFSGYLIFVVLLLLSVAPYK